VNGQFIWPWAKDNPWTIAIVGLPISYILIIATKFIVEGFDGLLWPGRFIGFGVGMIIYALMVSHFFNEGINLKTLTSLVLSTALVMVQVFWKS
jgi:hypothetical protein